MNLVLGYAAAAALSGAVAYMTGPAGGGAFWLYTAGAVLFALAAVGQFFKVNRQK
jgi:hypothetical protein